MHLDDLYSLLCSEETYQATKAAHLELSVPTALDATHYYGRGRTNHNPTPHGRSSARRGRGRHTTVDCQIYGKTDHSAFHCWHHSNLDFISRS